MGKPQLLYRWAREFTDVCFTLGRPGCGEVDWTPRPAPRHLSLRVPTRGLISMTRREAIESAVRILAPRIPRHEFDAVTDHALGSRGLYTATPEVAAWLSLTAYIRHRLTDYDELLDDGYDAESARFFVLDDMNGVLEEWGSPRRVSGEEGE